MTQFNIIATITGQPDGTTIDQLMAEFAEFHPSIDAGIVAGQLRLVLTIHAEGIVQAATTGARLVAHLDPVGVGVLETAEYDRTAGIETLPALMTAAQAAEVIGISRQAVTERIRSGAMPAVQVGQTWIIPAAAVRR